MDFDDGVLIITDSISVNATVVVWALQYFSVGLKDLRVITQASLLEGSLNFRSSSLSNIISISEKPGFHTQLWLLELAKILKPGGCVFLQEPSFSNPHNGHVLGESKACLERNLLFAGFYSAEGFECLDHTDEINCTSQDFELIAIKANRTYHVEEFSAFQKAEIHKPENVIVSIDDSLQPQVEEIDDLIDEDSLPVAEDPKRPELLQDRNSLIRERNRLYQRRRRARMTEEQKNREKEKRRQYMQRRRVQPVSCERSLSTSVSHEAKECEQGQFYGQELQEIHVSEIENDQVIGASEAL